MSSHKGWLMRVEGLDSLVKDGALLDWYTLWRDNPSAIWFRGKVIELTLGWSMWQAYRPKKNDPVTLNMRDVKLTVSSDGWKKRGYQP